MVRSPNENAVDSDRRRCGQSGQVLVTRALPTIHVQNLTSDKVGAVEVHNRLRDVADFAHVADRVQSAQCGVGFLAVHWGLDDAGRYGVYQCKNKSVPFCPPFVHKTRGRMLR